MKYISYDNSIIYNNNIILILYSIYSLSIYIIIFRKTLEINCLIISRAHQLSIWLALLVLILVTWLAKMLFARFLHCGITLFFPLSYCTSWKWVTIRSWHLMSGQWRSSSFRCSVCVNYILLQGRFVFSPSFTYLFNHLFVSLWTHWYLFYSLGYNPILCLFCC